MKQQIPKTKEEAFAQLDALLSEEDKKILIEDEEEEYDTHFSIGLWIRNNWIYPLSYEEIRSFMMIFADESESPHRFLLFHPDSVSSDIIRKYLEYLKERGKTTE